MHYAYQSSCSNLRVLAGAGPSSEQLEQGLLIFYKQLMTVLKLQSSAHTLVGVERGRMAHAARDSDDPTVAAASGRADEVELAASAGAYLHTRALPYAA